MFSLLHVYLYNLLFVGWLMSYLRYSCMFAHSGVQHILCCVFVLFFFVVLPVSLHCPFLIAAWIPPKTRGGKLSVHYVHSINLILQLCNQYLLPLKLRIRLPLFLCCPSKCLYVLSSVLWCPLRFPHKNDVRLSLPPVICRMTHVLFTLFVFVYIRWCPTHIMLWFCFVCLHLVSCIVFTLCLVTSSCL
jgi:hypothetical protein